MKKNFLVGLTTGFFLLIGISSSQADTIGNDVIDRYRHDNWTNFNTIDKDLVFTDSGKITDWSIYAGTAGDIYLQVLRNSSGNYYEIVGENYFDNVFVGFNTWAVDAGQQIDFLAGDYIGFSITSTADIDFDFGGNDVSHSNGPGSIITGTGNDVNLANFYQTRTYSISAETAPYSNFTETALNNASPSPAPEPATMILFGAGLASLFGARRKFGKK